MKKRMGFVSNSSSSSFIVVGEKPKVSCAKLDTEIARNILKYINSESSKKIVFDENKDYYLTCYLSDGGDYTDPFEHLDHYAYLDGNHGGPYSYEGKNDKHLFLLEGDEDDLFDSIFIRKKDLDTKKYFINEVKKLAKELFIENYTLTVK